MEIPPPVTFNPPAIEEVAVVDVASIVPVKSRSAWMPPLKVDVAVVVEKMKSTVGADVAPSDDAPVQYANVLLIPPESEAPEPQMTPPVESVWRLPEQLVSVEILMPPVNAMTPANVELALVPIFVNDTPCEKVEVPFVEVASMVPVWSRRS